MTEMADGSAPRELLAAFNRALIALSADDRANLHAPDAVYEFPLLAPDRQPRDVGREQIRAGLESPLVVEDVSAVHASLRDHGVEVSEVQQFPWGRFCFFTDPDGNGWSVQEPPR